MRSYYIFGNYSANAASVALAPTKGQLCGAKRGGNTSPTKGQLCGAKRGVETLALLRGSFAEQSGVEKLSTHQKYCIPAQGITRKTDQLNGEFKHDA
jgi:hypothetical protein